MYNAVDGNPWAAMPSLHFGASVLAAILLSESSRTAGAVGWTYAGVLGFALVYLGEHYVVDLLAGLGLVAAVRVGEPHAEPLALAISRPSSGSSGSRAAEPARARAAAGRDANMSGMARGREPEVEDRRPDGDDEAPSLFESPRKVLITTFVVLLLFAAIYVLLPKLIGLEDAIEKMGEGEWQWFAVAVGFNVLAFGSYVALFRGVIGENLVHLDWRESYQITMAGLAASRVLSAGGAGGVVLSYWALRKAGMRRAEAAERMVAFLVLLYAFYVLAVIVFGVLLETGVLAGPNPVSMTIVPAAIAGGVAIIFLLIMLIPGDLERRLSLEGNNWASRHRAEAEPGAGDDLDRDAARIRVRPRAPQGRARGPRRLRLLGGQHRDPLGDVHGLRRRRCRSASS